jgi:hypothetical protein
MLKLVSASHTSVLRDSEGKPQNDKWERVGSLSLRERAGVRGLLMVKIICENL